MARLTKISWCDSTFTPIIGCQPAGDGCLHCFARRDFDQRFRRAKWGPEGIGTRVLTSDAKWKEPRKWNREAACTCDAPLGKSSMEAFTHCPQHAPGGHRPRVFCGSLCDLFEDWKGSIANNKGLLGHVFQDGSWGFGPDMVETGYHGGSNVRMLTMNDVRRKVADLWDETPNLDYLVLTKRPENVPKFWIGPNAIGEHPYGAKTVQTPDGKSKACTLGRIVADRAIASGEVVEVNPHRHNVWLGSSASTQAEYDRNVELLMAARRNTPVLFMSLEPLIEHIDLRRIWKGPLPDWIIVGGESGRDARPCRIESIRSIVRQCKRAGIPCFVKQIGTFPRTERVEEWLQGPRRDLNGFQRTRDFKGGSPDEWPEDIRVREFPNPGARR